MRPTRLAAEEKLALGGLPDDEIVRRVRSGEVPLFELLMRRYNQRVYRAVRSLLRDGQQLEDALQQVWLAAYAHLDQFEGTSSFSTWLTRIALNEGLARLRQGLRLVAVADVEELEGMRHPSVGPEERTGDRELARMVEEAVDSLPEKYRSAFVLREIEGLSTADTATCLGISEDLVKVRLHRARLALRDALFTRAGSAAWAAFTFLGARCDRVVSRVLEVILRDAGLGGVGRDRCRSGRGEALRTDVVSSGRDQRCRTSFAGRLRPAINPGAATRSAGRGRAT